MSTVSNIRMAERSVIVSDGDSQMTYRCTPGLVPSSVNLPRFVDASNAARVLRDEFGVVSVKARKFFNRVILGHFVLSDSQFPSVEAQQGTVLVSVGRNIFYIDFVRGSADV